MKRYLINNPSAVWTMALLILIIGLGTFLRFYHIGKLSFWLDEAFTFTVSSGSLKNLITATKIDPNMSLYYILAFLWVQVVPDVSEGTLRALSAVFSVASIPVVFLLGRSMATDRKQATAIGLIASFLVAVNAFHIQYAQEFRGYSLTFLLTTLSTFLLIKAIEDTESKHHWLIWYSIITAAAVYSHFYVVFIIAAQVVTLPILLLDKNRHYFEFRRMLYSGIGMMCLILPVAILAYLRGTEGISWVARPTLGSVKSFAKLITGNQGDVLFAFYLLFGCIGFFWGEILGFEQEFITKWKFALVATCFFLPVIVALAISLFVIPIFVPKYLLYVMPYLAILAAAGVVGLTSFAWKREKYRVFVAPIGLGVLVLFAVFSTISIKSYYENYPRTDWRNAAQVLTTKCSESLRLYYAPYVDIAALYYNPALNSQNEEWFTNVLQNNPNSDELAASLPNGYNQVCLVLAHAADQNQQKIIQAAIQKKFPTVSTLKFYEMEIDIYKP